jgi:hypothetical protein
MFWILIIAAIIGYVLYQFNRDRDQMLERQVDMNGGMSKKYEYLINRLTDDPKAKVVKVTRDHIHICAAGQTTTTNFLITETFNSVQIEWVAQLGALGNHNHKWTFQHNYPQENMIQEIEKFMVWKSKEMFGN